MPAKSAKQTTPERTYTLRLVPELVPLDLFRRSAAEMLKGKAAWRKQIRPDAIARAGNKCEICGAEGKLICHDKWKYDDKKAVATLTGFEIHCPNCDLVTHYGRNMQIHGQAEVLRRAVPHLCAVNECSDRIAIGILIFARDQWIERSEREWKVAVAPALLKKYPELAGLPGFKPALIED